MKQIEETFTSLNHQKMFYVQTEDGDRYVFFFLPWHDKPLFSHRFSPGEKGDEGDRDFTNRLPTMVRKLVEEQFGGYYRQLLSEHEQYKSTQED